MGASRRRVIGLLSVLVVVGIPTLTSADPATPRDAVLGAAATSVEEPAPVTFDPCAGTTDVGQLRMRSGLTRVRATDDAMCFDGPRFSRLTVLGAPASVDVPTLTSSEVPEDPFSRPPGWLATIALPAGFAATGVRTSTGFELDWARTTNGRYAVVYDPAGPLGSTHFAFVGADGAELGRVATRCGTTEVGSITLGPADERPGGSEPVRARVLLTAERFCVVVDAEGLPFEQIWYGLELEPQREVERPTILRRANADHHPGALSTFMLPRGFPPVSAVRAAGGAAVDAVRSPDGRRLLVYDPDPAAGAGPFATATYRLVGADGTVLGVVEDGPRDPCADAVPVAELQLERAAGWPDSGRPLAGRVSAAADAFCVDVLDGAGPATRVSTVPLSPPQREDRPTLGTVGTSPEVRGGFALVLLPSGYPEVAEVRDVTGRALFSVRHPLGRHLLVHDPTLDGERLGRLVADPLRYTLVGAGGSVLAVVSTEDAAEGPAPSTTAAGVALPSTGRPLGRTVIAALAVLAMGLALGCGRMRGPTRPSCRGTAVSPGGTSRRGRSPTGAAW